MPANLTHLRRLAAVHRAIVAGTHNTDAIAALAQVHRRSAQRYIAWLRDLGAPAVYGRDGCFRYPTAFDFDTALLAYIHAA